MKQVLIAIAAITFVSSCIHADGLSEADMNALQQVVDDIVDAYNQQDLEGLVSHFHPDVGYLVPSRPYVEGKEAVRSMYEETFRRFRETGDCGYLRATTEEMEIMGDWAWVRGESQFVRSACGAVPNVPSDLPAGSKHLGVYKRENGQWLRYRQMRNGNTPDMNI
jgi:uncharacterized protein (TIGR02246 family)